MTLARDAGLAALVLGVVLAAGYLTGTAVAPTAFAAGGVSAIVLELLASVCAGLVRRAWREPVVRALSVVVAVAVVAAVAVFVPERGLNVLAGGLLTYIALVALVAVGALPAATAWSGE